MLMDGVSDVIAEGSSENPATKIKPSRSTGSSGATAEEVPKYNFGEKKKKKAPTSGDASKTEIIDGTGQVFVRGHIYPYEELLTRVQTLINTHSHDLSGNKKYTIRPPQVVRVGSKKVAWINFKDLCTVMRRSTDHVHQFVLSELGTEGSIAGDGQLVLKGKYGPKNIESLLRKYITEYVTCSMCKSANTTMERDSRARLFTQHCEACGANRSVNPIKNGFHALNRGERRKAKV
ncbi:Eukaryotic translation initiation factor 2 subunit beta [Babesia sp. Xinjiang]|uniref:Eukaryotic translation initiation factor 2 subunit beta n=1 Tax=Babesia sp. Xinjiang TaxID=462227 RepID=UPI000A256584|nr:Eukaryotic translation initiation factor 2 subunit beta [Babesia sp. Xinjiang]XP_028871405.1 Eukaryotic translation initiation factor 2 subunit beta [Babesia sp. Xinjiang]ORM40848.1 Eukaryotic translation initiation factor 2 subunit beta [Babesia sp. Xinjiang]ORM40949.1 Eukaryotic translation initiation factor 2 subunit beta [Babesia sp. Xinjiang]